MGQTLSPLQRRRIRQAIRDGHLAFLAETFGPSAIDRDDYARLLASGKIRDEKLMPQDAAIAAHAVGAVDGHGQVGELHGAAALLSDPDALSRHAAGGDGVVSEDDRDLIRELRDRAARHVRSLETKLQDAVDKAVSDVDNLRRRRRLTRADPDPAFAISRDLADRVRAAISDLRRDWLRAAHTEMHSACEEAKAIVFAHHDPNHDPRVFKRPRADACDHCKLIFLRPDGITPRVFRLSALLANGSNSGRSAGRPTRSGSGRTQWRAVVGALHPFCGCSLHVLPAGMGFDAAGNLTHVGVKKSAQLEEDEVADHRGGGPR